MRRFLTSCKDVNTGYEMILAECSYNEACRWLFSQLGDPAAVKIPTKLIEIKYHDRTFYYDEDRGILLGE